MQHHLDYLGWRVKDKVTGYVGVVTHVGLDLYGCVQAIVNASSSSKSEDPRWFDTVRLEKVGKKRVMEPVPEKTTGPDMYKPTK